MPRSEVDGSGLEEQSQEIAQLAGRTSEVAASSTIETAVVAAVALAVLLLATRRATFESGLRILQTGLPLLIPVLLVGLLYPGVPPGMPARKLQSTAAAVLLSLPLMAPALYSTGLIPLTPRLAEAFMELPVPVVGPPPDSLAVGHPAMFDEVAPGDCLRELPDESFWGFVVVECARDHDLEVDALADVPYEYVFDSDGEYVGDVGQLCPSSSDFYRSSGEIGPGHSVAVVCFTRT